MTSTTALTVQNTKGVTGVHVIPSDFVGRQIEACLEDVGADVIKTGEFSTTFCIIQMLLTKLYLKRNAGIRRDNRSHCKTNNQIQRSNSSD